MTLSGRHIFITGAAKRIGRRIAETLAEKAPCRIALHYGTSQREALELKTALEAKGSQALCVQADLGDPTQMAAAVKKAAEAFGPIDIGINSASIFSGCPSERETVPAWTRMLDVNLRGQFFCAQAIYQYRAPSCCLIHISDVHAEHPQPGFAAYCAAKAGLTNLSQLLAREWAPHVRSNAIHPGPVLFPENYTEEKKLISVRNTLLKRRGSPDDVAEAVVFLTENDYVNGIALHVDGGQGGTS